MDQAANKIVTDYKLNVVESRKESINGFPSVTMVSDQSSQNQQTGETTTIRIQTYLMQYNQIIYVFHGMSLLNDFNIYRPHFNASMRNFRRLTDQSKINVKPERIKIQTVRSDASLAQALKSFGTPQARLEELAVLNGMNQTDRVHKGMLIKTISK